MNPPKKTLLIFDFDSTITDADSFLTTTHVLNDKKVEDDIVARVPKENWIDLFNWFYDYLEKVNIPMSKVDKIYDELPITKGMIDLFDFLRQNKDKFEVLILSAGHSYGLTHVLKHNNLLDVIDELLCSQATVENGKIVVKQRYTHECPICNACQCKTKEYNDYMRRKGRENYGSVVYICDGANDVCLAKNLEHNDYLFPRKDFHLYEKLFIDGLKEKMNCKIEAWKDGNEVIDLIKKI